ncbi:hypothetical protein [Clostridium sp. FP1]|uniref:hypothetical protein n=1 Tax=Clostridium sp. FP1 TaxID=2724076 RepID=UPI0013E978A7|nr:hypothetical protein [Clostridium sp. FP1]MBZ9635610.1 hypothetical protein [Clostridium sp. FP1]
MEYINKLDIEIQNIPKERFQKIKEEIGMVLRENNLSLDQEKSGYVEAGFSGKCGGITLVLEG